MRIERKDEENEDMGQNDKALFVEYLKRAQKGRETFRTLYRRFFQPSSTAVD